MKNKVFLLFGFTGMAILSTVLFGLVVDRDNAFSVLENNMENLKQLSIAYPIVAKISYVLAYIILAVSCVPGMFLATTVGGVLFGTLEATFYTAIGTTIGSYICFFACRTYFKEEIESRFEKRIKMINSKIESGGFFYFLSLRLFLIFPYYLVNIVASVTNVKTSVFVSTTLVGMIPVHFFYSYVGASLTAFISGNLAVDPRAIGVVIVFGVLVFLGPTGWKKLNLRTG